MTGQLEGIYHLPCLGRLVGGRAAHLPCLDGAVGPPKAMGMDAFTSSDNHSPHLVRPLRASTLGQCTLH